MEVNTNKQFSDVIKECRKVYVNKLYDYGLSWRIFRLSSLTDQLLIKANRIRTLETIDNQMIIDDNISEFTAIVNYSIISLIQLELKKEDKIDIKKAIELYDKYSKLATELMIKKNNDYGEIWREMRVSSYTDLILTKIYRIKQIEDKDGKTMVSEGIDSNYYDIMNYSIFGLIRLTL